jgi:hypothetical protein
LSQIQAMRTHAMSLEDMDARHAFAERSAAQIARVLGPQVDEGAVRPDVSL